MSKGLKKTAAIVAAAALGIVLFTLVLFGILFIAEVSDHQRRNCYSGTVVWAEGVERPPYRPEYWRTFEDDSVARGCAQAATYEFACAVMRDLNRRIASGQVRLQAYDDGQWISMTAGYLRPDPTINPLWEDENLLILARGYTGYTDQDLEAMEQICGEPWPYGQ